MTSARPLGGRWPPATPRRRRQLPYDLDDPAYVRVKHRPNPLDWDPDEPILVVEVAALLFPLGPVKAHGLRQAAKDGRLAWCEHSGRHYTTIAAVREMLTPRIQPAPEGPPDPPPGLEPPPGIRRTPEQAALDAALALRNTRTRK